MPSNILFADEARVKLLKGATTLRDAVATTLGPLGHNVAIAKGDPKGNVYERIVVHDGVTCAKAIDPIDPYENMGASLIRESAQKQVDLVGDGTTVTIVLAHAILSSCLKLMAAGVNAMSLRRGIEEGVTKLIKEIEKHATPVKTLKDKIAVATISAEDKELGELIAKTLHDIGDDGVMTVEESRGAETLVEKQEGMQLDKGFVNPFFVTDPSKMTATISDCHVLVTDKPLTSIAEIGEFLNTKIFPNTKKLLFISPEVGGDLLPVLIENKLSGNFLSLAVGAPSFGDNQKQCLLDICALTGATFISQEAGHSFNDCDFSVLGKVEKVSANRSSTILLGGAGSKKAVQERISSIKHQLSTIDVPFDIEKLKERLGKLTNGIAVLRVGGQTEIEMKERKERALDAIAATKAAITDGIVAGGETIYLKIKDVLGNSPAETVLKEALMMPFKQLMDNSGLDSGTMLAVMGDKGIDVTDGKVKDLLKSGIIDPAQVSKLALKNGSSTAIMLATTGAVITPHYDKNNLS